MRQRGKIWCVHKPFKEWLETIKPTWYGKPAYYLMPPQRRITVAMGEHVINSAVEPAVVWFSRKSDAMMCKLAWAQANQPWHEDDPSMGSSDYMNPYPGMKRK